MIAAVVLQAGSAGQMSPSALSATCSNQGRVTGGWAGGRGGAARWFAACPAHCFQPFCLCVCACGCAQQRPTWAASGQSVRAQTGSGLLSRVLAPGGIGSRHSDQAPELSLSVPARSRLSSHAPAKTDLSEPSARDKSERLNYERIFPVTMIGLEALTHLVR